MPQSVPARLAFDDVVIDFAGRRLLRGGIEQPLEPKAFDVLALLAGAPGRVFARDDILDAVWGHPHVTPGVLNRIAALLRQALGEDAHHPRLLHTVHGVGYRFDLPAAPAVPSTGTEIGPAPEPAPGPAATSPESTAEAAPSRRFPRAALAAIPLLAALSAFTGWKMWPHTEPAAVDSAVDAPIAAAIAGERSVAVLPLVNASGDKEQQFFSDGVSENLIDALSQYEGLKVIGRSSSFRFRDGKEDSRAIGAKLGVTHLIAGSVQRAGDSVRIGVELVDAADGSTVWTQRFDRPYKDLFALQDEIALAVAAALQVKLLHALPGAVESGHPPGGDLDAYDAFLRGASFVNKDPLKAIEQFSEATRIDPDYAQAWQWMGYERTRYSQGLTGQAKRAACAQARKEIETAIGLAPDYGLGYAGLGDHLGACDFDWSGALAAFRKGIPLVSETSPAHGAYSRLLATLGRVDEAIEERRKHIVGDPLANYAYDMLAELQASAGRLDEAEASARKAMEVRPDDTDWAREILSDLAVLRGDATTALAEARRVSPGRWRDRYLALALQLGDDRAAADAALRRLIETDGSAIGNARYVARVYALRGEADRMFEWLERGWERRDGGVHGALYDPLLLRYRDDPRFAGYCKRAGLPPPSASEALSIDKIRAALAAKR